MWTPDFEIYVDDEFAFTHYKLTTIGTCFERDCTFLRCVSSASWAHHCFALET